jgi:excisionase family DNA binding protein
VKNDYVIPEKSVVEFFERRETIPTGIDWKETLLLWGETGDRLLTVHEAAEVLGEHPSNIYRLIKTKKLAAINVGLGNKRPTYRIPPANVIRK